MADSSEFIEQAKGVKAKLDTEVEKVMSSGYAPDMEKAQLCDVYLEVHQKMEELREKHRLAEVQEESTAAQKVFGADDLRMPSTDIATHQVSYRDAQDRAERADSEAEMMRLIQRADQSGDRLLARACAARAVRRGYSEVTAFYEDRNPGFSTLAREAQQARQGSGLARAAYFGLRKPEQIQGMSDIAMTQYRDRVGQQILERQAKTKPRAKYTQSIVLG